MKRWNKILAVISALAVTGAMMLTVNAAKASDYTACKYGKVSDAGTDTVKVSGKGYLGTTAAQGVNAASAAMYSKQVDTRNIKFTLNFLEDYGKGEGAQSGWYAFNLSATKDWFSSMKPVIAKSNVKGVVVIFKLNPNNKKDLILELSRYMPGSGFSNIFGQSIEIQMKNDWKCDVEIKNGKLTIDGNSIIDLSDSLDLTVGSGKGYIGFGGFSENHYDVAMNVTMKDQTAPVSSSASSAPATSSSAGKPPVGNTSKTSSPAAPPESSAPANSTASAPESSASADVSEAPTDSSVESSEPSAAVSDTAEESRTESTDSTAPAGTKEEKNNTGLIVGIVIAAIVVIGGGVAGFLIYRKKKMS